MARRQGRKVQVKFVQIAAGQIGLYGLDRQGNVWQYHPADYNAKPARWAFWTRLTSFGSDNTTSTLDSDEEDPVWQPHGNRR